MFSTIQQPFDKHSTKTGKDNRIAITGAVFIIGFGVFDVIKFSMYVMFNSKYILIILV